MTKASTPATATEILVAPKRPASIQLIGPAFPTLHEMAVHIRSGYVPHPGLPATISETGMVAMLLILGEPNLAAIERAKQSTHSALLLEQEQYNRDVKVAAANIVQQQKRDEIAQRIASAVAERDKAIAKLQRDADAELASLQAQ